MHDIEKKRRVLHRLYIFKSDKIPPTTIEIAAINNREELSLKCALGSSSMLLTSSSPQPVDKENSEAHPATPPAISNISPIDILVNYNSYAVCAEVGNLRQRKIENVELTLPKLRLFNIALHISDLFHGIASSRIGTGNILISRG